MVGVGSNYSSQPAAFGIGLIQGVRQLVTFSNLKFTCMEIVEFFRCCICAQVASIADLEPNSEGSGMVCVDKSACRKQVTKSQERARNEKREPPELA